MQEINASIQAILFNDPTIVKVVGTRIFTGPIWNAPQPEYPALVLSRTVSGSPIRAFPGQDFELQFSVFSTKGYDEGWVIVNRIEQLINRQSRTVGTKTWTAHAATTPVSTSERIERQIYGLHVTYDIVVIG